MATSNQAEVQNTLHDIRDDATEQELVFDPTTGKLLVKKKTETVTIPDAVVATNVAKDGFFVQEKVIIYESELERIAKWTAQSDIETGGSLFGFFTYSKIPIVQFAIGPGPNANRSSVDFFQDEEYLIKVGKLVSLHTLQHVGEWHSHHKLNLDVPSSGDNSTIHKTMDKNNFSQFTIFITSSRPSTININGFNYEKGTSNYVPVSFIILKGITPFDAYDTLLQLHKFENNASVNFDCKKTTLSSATTSYEYHEIPNNGEWYTSSDGNQLLHIVKDNLEFATSEHIIITQVKEQKTVSLSWKTYTLLLPSRFPEGSVTFNDRYESIYFPCDIILDKTSLVAELNKVTKQNLTVAPNDTKQMELTSNNSNKNLELALEYLKNSYYTSKDFLYDAIQVVLSLHKAKDNAN
jgi:hypothetical protein